MINKDIIKPIIQCVNDMMGQYGRTTIARILTGSVSKKILSINLDRLNTYGILRENTMIDTLNTIDYLIESGHIEYKETYGYPTIKTTKKGIKVLGE